MDARIWSAWIFTLSNDRIRNYFACILTAFIFHFDFTDQTQFILFLKNVGLAGGFLFIVANGTKEWSVDKEKKYVRL